MSDTIDLARKLVELKCWRWMAGMSALAPSDGGIYPETVYAPEGKGTPYPLSVLTGDTRARPVCGAIPHDATPDLHDPATVGCLHTLAEEVVGRRVDVNWVDELGAHAAMLPSEPPETGKRNFGVGPTRGEALADLLLQWAVRNGEE